MVHQPQKEVELPDPGLAARRGVGAALREIGGRTFLGDRPGNSFNYDHHRHRFVIIKNKQKRIAPRYFLNETADRDNLEEGGAPPGWTCTDEGCFAPPPKEEKPKPAQATTSSPASKEKKPAATSSQDASPLT